MDILTATEIIEWGIDKEKKRCEFYAFIAAHTPDAELKGLFNQLSTLEATHVKVFTTIKDNLEQSGKSFSNHEELDTYVQNLVYTELHDVLIPERFNKMIKTPRDAINFAIQCEHDAIQFFSRLLPYVERLNKDIVNQLIDEERQHIKYLDELKKQYD